MNEDFDEARAMLRAFRGERYAFGRGVLGRVGPLVRKVSRRVVLIAGASTRVERERGSTLDAARASLQAAGVEVAGDAIAGARPNTPTEDVLRIRGEIADRTCDALVVIGGGSAIDGTKAAASLAAMGDGFDDVDACFGVGRVAAMLNERGAAIAPICAIETAASSASHLTKYANVTDLASAQKKLIVDEAIIPAAALFDYDLTASMSSAFTADGGLDGMSHALEVYYGAKGETAGKVKRSALEAIRLIATHLKRACDDPGDMTAREALGLGTDLGGVCIMIGGTNGGHLSSFSLVDVLPHGRACGLMNPYYTVFFAPAIQPQLREVGRVLAAAGYADETTHALSGRELGEAVARGMQALARDVGCPTTLGDVPGFSVDHVKRALAAAKNPQLAMKLQAMPVPLSAATVDEYMGPVFEAARTGDFSVIRNVG